MSACMQRYSSCMPSTCGRGSASAVCRGPAYPQRTTSSICSSCSPCMRPPVSAPHTPHACDLQHLLLMLPMHTTSSICSSYSPTILPPASAPHTPHAYYLQHLLLRQEVAVALNHQDGIACARQHEVKLGRAAAPHPFLLLLRDLRGLCQGLVWARLEADSLQHAASAHWGGSSSRHALPCAAFFTPECSVSPPALPCHSPALGFPYRCVYPVGGRHRACAAIGVLMPRSTSCGGHAGACPLACAAPANACDPHRACSPRAQSKPGINAHCLSQ